MSGLCVLEEGLEIIDIALEGQARGEVLCERFVGVLLGDRGALLRDVEDGFRRGLRIEIGHGTHGIGVVFDQILEARRILEADDRHAGGQRIEDHVGERVQPRGQQEYVGHLPERRERRLVPEQGDHVLKTVEPNLHVEIEREVQVPDRIESAAHPDEPPVRVRRESPAALRGLQEQIDALARLDMSRSHDDNRICVRTEPCPYVLRSLVRAVAARRIIPLVPHMDRRFGHGNAVPVELLAHGVGHDARRVDGGICEHGATARRAARIDVVGEFMDRAHDRHSRRLQARHDRVGHDGVHDRALERMALAQGLDHLGEVTARPPADADLGAGLREVVIQRTRRSDPRDDVVVLGEGPCDVQRHDGRAGQAGFVREDQHGRLCLAKALCALDLADGRLAEREAILVATVHLVVQVGYRSAANYVGVCFRVEQPVEARRSLMSQGLPREDVERGGLIGRKRNSELCRIGVRIEERSAR